jgi:hypothetical protein
MAYIGLQPRTRVLSTSTQVLNSDGTSYEYTLNRAVSKSADLRVFVGNTSQVPEVDYTASGTQILFTNQPAAGNNNISVSYVGGALTTVNLTSSSFPQGTGPSPSIRYVDGTSTGIYFPSTSSIGLSCAGNTRVTITDSPSAVSASTGALRVSGGVGISQALVVGGVTTIVDNTESTDPTSGAIVTLGGIGCGASMHIGGQLTVAGDFTVAGQFTTTSSDSLTINDPFLFLANANAGDSLDAGFISSYVTDTETLYTGFFRDVTDGKYKLFKDLTNQPTTTVDTGNVSFAYADAWFGAANITSTTASTTSTTGALTVWGGIGARGAIFVNSVNNATAIGNGGTNGTGNIGASGATFNTIFAKATTAQYADVAEKYLADADYEPGTVLHFGGEKEVSLCTVDACKKIAGVVSTQPAYIMNDALEAEHVATVALLGRVPTKVVGPIAKGDMLVSAGNGHARAEANPSVGTVIGKALENFDGTQGVIEIVVGKN